MFIRRKAAKKLAEKYQVSMPIVSEINEVLFGDLSAKDALAKFIEMRQKEGEHLKEDLIEKIRNNEEIYNEHELNEEE